MLSIVATETSALTVISIPGIAARGDLTFLQLAFGYLAGRIGVAALLLPGYFEGTQDTAYQRLERRFGRGARRAASGVFLLTRALADCVRIFATAIPLAIITHWSLPAGILAIGIVTVIYTWVGGLRAVVWVDVIQLGVYLLGGVATLVVATRLAGGPGAFARAWDAGKLVTLDFTPSFKVLYTFWGGVLGGALLAGASHGTDPPGPRGPLAHAAVDGGPRGGCDGVPQPEHPCRAARPERRVDHLRRPARHLSAGWMVVARAPARRRRRDHRERARDDPRRARRAVARAAGARMAVVRAAGHGGDGRGGDAVLTGRTVRHDTMTSRSARPPARPSAVFLGCDAGGSHSSVVVGSPAHVLGRADGPGAAMRPGGAVASAAVLADTARRAASQGGIPLPGDAAVVGAAGAGRRQEQAELEAALGEAGVARRVRVLADGEAALTRAFARGPGVLVNAGTGSIAYARAPDGEIHRAGGYGWQLGDEGGGYWLGRRALDVAARAQDGRGEGSTLLARLLGALGLQTFDDLVRWTATATPAQVAALAPHVINAAGDGEAVAQRAVEEAARELVALVLTLERHYPGTGPVSVATAGGLLVAQAPLAEAFRTRLAAESNRARLVTTRVDTPVGALKLAAQME